MIRIIWTSLTSVLLLGVAISVSAGITPDQIARLGADLTPLGGERAGSQEATSATVASSAETATSVDPSVGATP